MSSSRPRTTSFVEAQNKNSPNFGGMKISSKDGSKVSQAYNKPTFYFIKICSYSSKKYNRIGAQWSKHF